MTRKTILACMSALLFSVSAWAGLGPMIVHSHLDEPFRAVVMLEEAGSLGQGQVYAGLADRATFNDLNVIYDPELQGLRFSVQPGPDGPEVRIRSTQPIHASYLQFVLELKSPLGRWVRTYSAQLRTPPAVPAGEGDVVPVPVTPVQSGAGTPARMTTIRVPHGGTLASVARKVRPAGVSLNQTMASLFQANPSRFNGHNPLRLKAGAVLVVPGRAQMHALPESRARAVLGVKPVAMSVPVPGGALPPRHVIPAVPAAPVRSPASSIPTVSASAAAAQASALQAASDAVAISVLQQQVDQRARSLQDATRHINDLQLKIKALEASQAQAQAQAQSRSALFFGGKMLKISDRMKWIVAAGSAVALLLAGLLWRLLRRRGKAKLAKGAAGPAGAPVAGKGGAGAAKPGEGDPIAEAEVYLAYGHEDKAEEVLRKGLDRDPSRQDIRHKLMEIYATRPDRVRFERLAHDVHDAYDGRGPMWERARAMGYAIDPDNPLYQSADTVNASRLAAEPLLDFADMSGAGGGAANETAALSVLDFEPAPPAPAPAPAPVSEPEVAVAPDDDLLNFDFSLEEPVRDEIAPVTEKPEIVVEQVEHPLDILSEEDEALTTKLDLARVYMDMGDKEGAREVLQELLREARGVLKQKAEEMLTQLLT